MARIKKRSNGAAKAGAARVAGASDDSVASSSRSSTVVNPYQAQTNGKPTTFAAKRRKPSKSGLGFTIRRIFLAAAAGYFLQKTFSKSLLPWGGPLARQEPVASFAAVNTSDDTDLLLLQHNRTNKIYEKTNDKEALLKGAETIVFGKDGSMYLLTEHADLVQVGAVQKNDGGNDHTMQASLQRVRTLGPGRPLGGRVTPDGKTLYYADAVLGLVRIPNFAAATSASSKLEVLASEYTDPETGIVSRITYANDVTIGPKTGKIYFTDSTTIPPTRDESKRTWDTLYASKMDLVRGGPGTGRLFSYDPAKDALELLVSGLKFANGVATDKDESYVLFCETFGISIKKYHLKGPLKGTVEKVLDSSVMTGYLDGLDCDYKTGKCYATLPSTIVLTHKLWNLLPSPLETWFRTLLMILPRAWAPKTVPYGGILEFHPDNATEYRYLQDAKGQDLKMLTGVTVHNSKLYLGSLKNDYIGVYDLE